jgi:NAD(P)-dependent dehydrogenase (short-subunit alcohol dehydrogenase family)
MTPVPAVVLTGATSGIGLAAAARFAPLAQTLVVHGPEESSHGEEIPRPISVSSPDTTVHYVQADYPDRAASARMADRVTDPVPRIDVLVNNAGIPGPQRRTVAVERR